MGRGGWRVVGAACWLLLLAVTGCALARGTRDAPPGSKTPTSEADAKRMTTPSPTASARITETPTSARAMRTASPTLSADSATSTLKRRATSSPLPTTIPPERTREPSATGLVTPSTAPGMVPATATALATGSPVAPATATPIPPTGTPAPPTATATGVPTVGVWEQEITLHTYGWQDALVPTEPGDPVYPYPRLDFDAVTPPEPRPYRAVVIQNGYVRLVVLPELGGRILRWTDRVTGRQLFYANPVIKPTRWGYRGWWLGTGGMEWAFPTDEHGLNEYRPWQYQLLQNSVRVWDREDRTGMTVEVTIGLPADRSAFSVTPRITNPTGEAHAFQFWANAMLTLSDANRPSPGLTFVLPDDQVTVHATADGGLPGPGGSMSWPIHDGQDFSRYDTWPRYLGVFADPAQAGFFGAYDQQRDQGIVRVFPHTLARGVKIFCLGDLDATLWTDDGSRYVELWGGLTPTFWDNYTLNPGGTISWTEQWYAVSGIGGYNWANEEAAIRIIPSGDSARLAVLTTHPVDATVVLRRGATEVERWEAHIAPDRPFQASGGPASGGDWGVQVVSGRQIIARLGP